MAGLLLIPLAACSNAARYKPYSPGEWVDSSGHETHITGRDRFLVAYRLQSSLSAGGMTVRQLKINAFYRAAEVAAQQGKPYFTLTNLTEYEAATKPYAPESLEGGSKFLGGIHVLRIEVFSSDGDARRAATKEVHPFVYDADEVMNRLRPRMIF